MDMYTGTNKEDREYSGGKTLVSLGDHRSRGCSGMLGIDLPAFLLFARRAGPRACLQAVGM
jgi:hypothetical protein